MTVSWWNRLTWSPVRKRRGGVRWPLFACESLENRDLPAPLNLVIPSVSPATIAEDTPLRFSNVIGTISVNDPNVGGNSLSVLLGNGDGTFESRRTFPAGVGPTAVAVADVNGDGKPDLLPADVAGDNQVVLLGNGDGTFQPGVTYPVARNPSAIAVADVNGDGITDLVLGHTVATVVDVLLGNGDGTFQPTRQFAVGSRPVAVAVRDLNGDGNPDVATANRRSNDLSLLFGNGDGSFGSPTRLAVGGGPTAVAVGDLNGDGRTDLIAANSTDVTLSVLLGNGSGTFQPQQTFPTGGSPAAVVVRDLNGDGKLDLITANEADGTLGVLLGKGDGTFQTSQTFAAGSAPSSVAVADVNGDGKLDLVAANTGDGTLSVLLGNSDGTFQAQQTFSAGSAPSSVAVSDVNGDGNADLISADPGILTVTVASTNGTLTATGVGVSNNGTANITITGTESAVNAILDSLTYQPTPNYNGPATVTLNATDSLGATATPATIDITVTAVNDPPVVVAPISPQNVVIETASAFQVPLGTFVDVDGDTLTYSATLTSGVALPAWLTFTPLTRTFSGTPAAGDIGTITVRLTASEGIFSAFNDFEVTVAAANTVPTITVPSNTVAGTEDTPVVFNGTLSIADPDVGDTVTVTLDAGADGTFTAVGSGTAVVGALNLSSLTITGTVTHVNTALTGLTFRPTLNANGPLSFTVDAKDRTTAAAPQKFVSLNLAAINDAPVVSAPGSAASVTQGTTTTIFSGGAISVSDVDAGGNSVDVTLSVPAGQGALALAPGANTSGVTFGGSANVLTLTGPLSNVNVALSTGLSFTALSTGTSVTLTIGTDDQGNTGGGAQTDSQTATINLTPVPNSAPVLNPSFQPALTTILEDATSDSNTGTTVDAIVATTNLYADANAGDPKGVAITGTTLDSFPTGNWQYSTNGGATWNNVGTVSDASALLLGADGGGQNRIRFAPAADYFTGGANGNPTVTFRAWDGTDAKSSGATGANVIAAGTGGSNAYSSATATGTLTITAVNDAPSILALNGDGVEFTEGGTPIKLDQGGDAAVTDPDTGTNFGGGTFIVSVSGNKVKAEDQLGIDTSGTVTVTGGIVSVGGTVIGTVTGGGTGGADLVIALNASANGTLLWQVLRNLTYSNGNAADPSTAARTITYTLVDGGGTTNGGADTAVVTSTVNVVAANDTPVVTAPASAASDTRGTTMTTFTGGVISVADADAGAGDVVVTLSVPAGQGTLALAPGATTTGVTLGGSANVLTLTGPVANVNAALATGLRFTAPASGTSVILTIAADDQGNTGGGARTNSRTATITLTAVGKAAQAIAFPTPAPVPFSAAATATLSATSSSALPVGYTVVSGPGRLNGNVLTATDPGAVVVRATQPGDATFAAATPVEVTVVFRPVGSSAFPEFTTSGTRAGVTVRQPDGSSTPVPGTGPGSRAVVADVTGDGVADTLAVTGPGTRATVLVTDGASGRVLRTLTAFEDTFRDSAVLAAGDVNGDGVADIAVGADAFGGPRVTVFDGATGSVLADFYGIDDPDFRGGVRVALGDFNGDGLADLAVAAGVGGGPRVAVWDGRSLRPGVTPTRLVDDFFCFEPTLRHGANVALGDVNGDGKTDLILSGGPGGGPRVLVWDAADFLATNGGARKVLANFFAGEPSLTGGARVAAKDLDADRFADLVVGIPTGPNASVVRSYLGKDLTPSGTSPVFDEIPLDAGGVFVG